jgi:predicted acylesterase/phospholipase RssA
MRTFSHPVSTQPAVSHRPSFAPRTAFVLAGGASLGAMQVGMLRGLYERGVAPDLLVGTSAGALNAAYIASRPQTVATAEAAIPGVLPPVRQGDRLLLDGGVVNPTPISQAVELGAERLYVLATDDPVARAVALTPRRALDAAAHALAAARTALAPQVVESVAA